MHLLKTSCAFLVAIALSFGAVSNNALAAGDLSKTCKDAQLKGAVLSATCQKAASSVFQSTSIDLDRHIQNANSNLSWGGTGFSKACDSLDLSEKSTLKAQCKTVDGATSKATSINLNEHIANIDGNLTYEP